MDASTSISPEMLEMLDGPAMTPPEGQIPQLDNPPNMNTIGLVATSLCLATSTVFLIARTYATFIVLKKPYIIDYLMIIAYAFFTAICALTYLVILRFRILVHQWNYRVKNMPDMLYFYIMVNNLCYVMMGLIKACILLEWVRIFCPIHRKDYLWWGYMVLIAMDLLFHVGALIAFNLECRPHEKLWNRLLEGWCMDDKSARSLDIISTVVSTFIDLTILFLPQKVIWGLQMKLKQKAGVASIFAVGILGIVSSVFRLETTVRYFGTEDVSFIFSEIVLWALAEATSGLVVLGMPILPRAFSALHSYRIFSKIRTKISGGAGMGGTGQTGSNEMPSSWSHGRYNNKSPVQYSEIDNVPLNTYDSSAEIVAMAISTDDYTDNVEQNSHSGPGIRRTIRVTSFIH